MSMGHLSRRAFLRQSATVAAAGATAPLWLSSAVRREAWARTRGMVAHPAGTTYERTIEPITRSPYTRLREAEGWPLVVREDLGTRARPNRELRRVALASVLHLTDVQIPDAQSPARTEWLGRFFTEFRAAWRPHEAVVNHVSEAAVRQSGQVGRGPVTGRRYDFAVSTGDNIDNMQENELRWFLTLLNGGPLDPNSGHPARYEGVQEHWQHPQLLPEFELGYDDFYWRPDEPPAGLPLDHFKAEHGYPTLGGFLEAAIRPFVAQGLGIPWYSMYGNHDGLVQGNVAADPFFDAIATGQVPGFPVEVGPKIVGFPPGYPWTEAGAQQFFADIVTGVLGPAELLAAPFRVVVADPRRRLVGPHEYVRAHWEWTDGEPSGHGFTEDNLGEGTTPQERDDNTTLYYTFRPVPGAPILGVALDTTNRLGGAAGSIGRQQFDWLEERLEEVHSRWYDAGGRLQRAGGRRHDHLVVVFAHHNLETMGNLLPSPDDPERVPTAELRDLLHRFPNVIAFVNGHSHINRVWARHDASGRTQGFWEIATSAQLDYPMQVRVLEITDNRDQTLSIFCSLVDQGGPADPRPVFGEPGGGYELLELAAYGRELAYNDFRDHENHGDPFDHRVGTLGDRNVELLLRVPFPLGTTGPPQRVQDTLPGPARPGR
jgi:metallophosphoesterase (TIGR03767 family)